MLETRLFIKNMVCGSCIRVVREELERLSLAVDEIILGEALVSGEVSSTTLGQIEEALAAVGFELIQSDEKRIVEHVKHLIIKQLHHPESKPDHQNFSDFLASQTGVKYWSLSKVFSNHEGITIKKYIILQKIERAKELISYGDTSLNEIAFGLGYSSMAHFSSQFKRMTGVSPIAFKKNKFPERKALDQVYPPFPPRKNI